MKPTKSNIAVVFIFTILILVLGYIAFGVWTALIFTSGFLGGFILWLVIPITLSFANIKVPFWLTFFLFLVHRVEEKIMGFFAALSKLTDIPVPEITSIPVILLILTSVGAWLFIPVLMKKGHVYGGYLAWTFFAAMGITELAHFIFPLFTNVAYGYFPGMASVFILAPAAWWGMRRLTTKNI